jgi:hypothetical protein
MKIRRSIVNALHARHIRPGFLQGGDARFLDHGIGRNEKILVQLLNRADVFPGRNEITQAQAGHGKQFGETVEHEGAVRELEYRMFLAFINHPW